MMGVDRALFWALAFLVFAATAGALAGRAVDRLAAGYEDARTGYAIVRVLAPEGDDGLEAARAALQHAPHVTSAQPMTQGRAATLLAQWSGSPVRPEDMPTLRLIEIDLAPAPDNADVSGDIVAALAAGGVTAQVIEAPDASSGGGLATRVRTGALWGSIAFAALMALIVSLAARGMAARRRELVTVMTDLGATSGQAAGRVADEAAMLGLSAGVAGALLAGIAALVAIYVLAGRPDPDTLRGYIHPVDLAPVIAAPFIAAIAASLGARATAVRFHRQAARLG